MANTTMPATTHKLAEPNTAEFLINFNGQKQCPNAAFVSCAVWLAGWLAGWRQFDVVSSSRRSQLWPRNSASPLQGLAY